MKIEVSFEAKIKTRVAWHSICIIFETNVSQEFIAHIQVHASLDEAAWAALLLNLFMKTNVGQWIMQVGVYICFVFKANVIYEKAQEHNA